MKPSRWTFVLFALLLASSIAPSAGAVPGPPHGPGDYDQVILSGGLYRSYIVHVPPGYDGATPLPLVLALHGLGGTAQDMMAGTNWNGKADQANFVVAYLQGTDPTGVVGTGWNSGIWPASGITADDVGFVRDVILTLEWQLKIDTRRVYAQGFSNGGFMAHRLGVALPDLLAGVAVVEGTIGVAQPGGQFLTVPAPTTPMPIVIFHGEADQNVPYDGGTGTAGFHLDVKSVADAVAMWTQGDGCVGSPTVRMLADGNVITDYTACAGGSEVMLFTLIDGVHAYPTLQNAAKVSATVASWNFFARHVRGGPPTM